MTHFNFIKSNFSSQSKGFSQKPEEGWTVSCYFVTHPPNKHGYSTCGTPKIIMGYGTCGNEQASSIKKIILKKISSLSMFCEQKNSENLIKQFLKLLKSDRV